jgi:hypothetical protein
MGAEMKGHCVGPMPIEEFLDKFLPTSEIQNLPTLTFRRGIFDQVIHAERELKAYEPFVSLRDYHTGIAESLTLMFQIGAMQSFGPALSFVNTSGSAASDISGTFSFAVKPDICVYADGTTHGCHVSTAEVIVEFKWDAINDAFCDPPLSSNVDGFSFINQTMKGMDTLGQITSYAAAQLGAQYRTHIFSVLIVGSFARIIRWDMEGAIVTCTFNYNTEPHLADFSVVFHKHRLHYMVLIHQ